MCAVLKLLIDFLFPPRCPACERYVEASYSWCEDCLRRDSALRRLALPRELAIEVSEGWCVAYYREGVKKLLRNLKYRQKKSVIPYLRPLLKQAEPIIAKLPPNIVAVPVPLAIARQKERGFNQTVAIYEEWLGEQGIVLEEVLVRRKETLPLYNLNAGERRQELKGAFALIKGSEASLAEKDILLIDDIMTTGATLFECVRALRRADVGRITILVLASEHI